MEHFPGVRSKLNCKGTGDNTWLVGVTKTGAAVDFSFGAQPVCAGEAVAAAKK